MSMTTLTYQVSFNTPAFVGNAEQSGQWRTPPFKALLRQWWRVVKAPDQGYDHHKLLGLENELFGSALDGEGSSRSRVQLRLSGWDAGTLTDLPRMATQQHPEVKDKQTGQLRPVGTAVYLGFGPVTTNGNRNAIAPNVPVTFKLRCPDAEADSLRKAMQLIAWFGTVGSRSRNGWGSLHFEGEGLLGWGELCDSKLAEHTPLRSITTALADRLAAQWAHSVGLCADGRPAVWRLVAGRNQNERGQTVFAGFRDWKQVLEQLAALKIGFRTQFSLEGIPSPHNRVEDRHVLAYPVTNHGLVGLPNARLASQMRFKVSKNKEGQYFGLIVHLPCAMPSAFFNNNNINVTPPTINDQIEVWQQVHQFLNQQPPNVLVRIRKG